jgi:hypothetical protein
MGEGELELSLPSPKDGRGAGGEGKDLSLHWDAPLIPPWTFNFFNSAINFLIKINIQGM